MLPVSRQYKFPLKEYLVYEKVWISHNGNVYVAVLWPEEGKG